MRKMTLLEMVQNILSALDSDEVNSINDTIESLQVAEIVKETFYEQFNNIYVPEFRTIVQLQPLNDVGKPNAMLVPDNVSKVEWIKYRDVTSTILQDVTYVSPEEFLTMGLAYRAGPHLFFTDDPSGAFSYYIRTNKTPTYFTMFDDKHVIFDSYDTRLETAMTASNSLAMVHKANVFELEDDFVPPLDGNLFPLLLAEAKSTAFVNLKQMSSVKEEQRARRQRIRMQNDQFRSRSAQYSYWNRGPNYSRHR